MQRDWTRFTSSSRPTITRATRSLAFAGDVDTDHAIALAQRYFEEIPGGPVVPPVDVPGVVAPPEGDARLVLEDRVELPRLYLSWRTPALFAEGDAELDLLADILASGKASRLYRLLVHDRRIATDVAASQNSGELGSFFYVVATASPGHDLAELEQVITEELGRLLSDGPRPTDLERSVAQVEASFVYRLETVGGFGGKADQLNAYNVFVGDPGFFERDLARYRGASATSIQATASTYLSRDRGVTLSVVPRGRPQLAVAHSTPVNVS